MRKRTSRRRWKAKALRGQTIPWSAIVEHRLEHWGQWERRHDYQDAYLLNILSQVSLDGSIRRAYAALAEGIAIISAGPHHIRTISADEYYL